MSFEASAGQPASPSGRQLLIELSALSKKYVTDTMETHALIDVTLAVAAGEYLAIEGPSGCGKSTLLSILGLMDRPTRGRYVLAGREVGGLSLAQLAQIRNREIGFVFQNFNLIGDLTVFENVELPLTYRGVPRDQRGAAVHEVLERVGMTHRRSHYPRQLSGGQQQRVAVARAIVGSPKIVLADEPTGNLDEANGEAVMKLLSEIHRSGATVVTVTHDRRYNAFADRVVRLADGRLNEVPPQPARAVVDHAP